MKQLTIEQLKLIIGQMEALQKEHPKAVVLFDIERNQVQITYPLPKDYFKLQKVSMEWDKENPI